MVNMPTRWHEEYHLFFWQCFLTWPLFGEISWLPPCFTWWTLPENPRTCPNRSRLLQEKNVFFPVCHANSAERLKDDEHHGDTCNFQCDPCIRFPFSKHLQLRFGRSTKTMVQQCATVQNRRKKPSNWGYKMVQISKHFWIGQTHPWLIPLPLSAQSFTKLWSQ